MRFLRSLAGLGVALVVVLFAIDNRQETTVGFFPLADRLAIPVYLVALLPLVAGLLAGWMLCWGAGGKSRGLARRWRRERVAPERGPANTRERPKPGTALSTKP